VGGTTGLGAIMDLLIMATGLIGAIIAVRLG
jgi:hypothetical protein